MKLDFTKILIGAAIAGGVYVAYKKGMFKNGASADQAALPEDTEADDSEYYGGGSDSSGGSSSSGGVVSNNPEGVAVGDPAPSGDSSSDSQTDTTEEETPTVSERQLVIEEPELVWSEEPVENPYMTQTYQSPDIVVQDGSGYQVLYPKSPTMVMMQGMGNVKNLLN